MPVYLKDVPLPQATARFQHALEQANLWRVLGIETVPLDEHALGRVLAGPIWAKVSSPHYHASAMDGFAVRAEDTVGALPEKPISLPFGRSTRYVDTGDPLPDGFDSVIPIEEVESLDGSGQVVAGLRNPDCIRIRAAVTPWNHVRPMGEDIVQSQLILAEGHLIRPVDLGAIAASGYQSIPVARRPRVAILPTGSELVPPGSDLKPGEIVEFNSLVLAGEVIEWGGQATRYRIIPDDFQILREQVREAAQIHDLVLLNAGSSAGSEDYSASVVEALGDLLVHGVAVRPGHPVILGMIHRQPDRSSGKDTAASTLPEPTLSSIPIIGVPGYPVSAALTGDLFVEPLLAKWLGHSPRLRETISATLTRKTVSSPGDDDYVRVTVGKVLDKTLAAPLARGAGVITSLVHADGLLLLPRGIQGVEAGDSVEVQLLRPRAEIAQTIFCIGSHDMILDLLARALSRKGRRLSSANVGSLGGLIALQRGEAHLAGSHLLDPESGEYNLRYIHEYLSGTRVNVYGFVGRVQGLILKKGNPMGIRGLEDLTRPQIRFINRQRGAGTRVLLDYSLAQKGIPSANIRGYDLQEYTHLGVAAAVASGRADCGLGIAAAAQALGLDFIPLFDEQYQLIIPKVHAESDLLQPLLATIAESEFQSQVAGMVGYSVADMGKLLQEL
jgi:putative molybdopterin biosynthesis protein